MVARPRTEYETFKALPTCYHKAGHIVVAHSFGWGLRGVRLGEGNDGGAYLTPRGFHEGVVDTKAKRAKWLAGVRRGMTVVAAGPIAGEMHQRIVGFRGYSCRDERRAYRNYPQILVSIWFPDCSDNNPTSDFSKLVFQADQICQSTLQLSVFSVDELGLPATIEHIRVEILRADRKAEAILKKSWDVVTEIATRLHKSKKWELSRKQLLAVLEPA